MGWITNVESLSNFLKKASSRRADFMLCSDSNALFGGIGQDHGINKTLANKLPFYRTPLFSMNENVGLGSGQGYFTGAANDGSRVQTNPISSVPEYNRLLPYVPSAGGSFFPANYWYQISGQTSVNNNGITVTNGGPFDVDAPMKYSLTYGTFKSSAGVGKIRPSIRRGSAPFTSLADVGADINPSAPNAEGLVDIDLDITAGVRGYPIDGRLIASGTTGAGPFYSNWNYFSWPLVTKGISFNVVGYYGGVGLRTFVERESVAQQDGWNEYFRQVKRAQGTEQPTCCFVISSGLNDRNDFAPSVGPIGGLDSSTPAGFADNLRGLLNFFESKWRFAGLNRENLYFLMLGSHPISAPDNTLLIDYRAQAAAIAGEYVNMTAVDMAEFNTQLQANAAAWYAAAGSDTNHMTQTGYEEFYALVFDGLFNAAIAADMPSPKSIAFLPWKNSKYADIRSYCTQPRATTYYFSTSGNNANSGLTPALAKQTIAEANTLIANTSGNITILFKRGDQWNTNVSLAVNKANIEIGAYGTGNLPWFNRFAQKYNASGWTLAAGTRYTRAEAVDTAWVRFQSWDESKSTVVGKYLSRQTSQANCEATSNSFFWSAGTLHVNLGAVNPNTVNLEGNVTSTTPGIVVSKDRCYVHDIRVDGFGQDFSNPHTPQSYQIQWAQGSNEVGYAYNCETYYGGTRLHAQYQSAGSGAITLIESCSAGFAMQGVSGEAVFNTYSSLGLQQTFFVGCNVLAGTLPNGTAAWVRRGVPFYGSTAGAVATGLIIADRNTIAASAVSCDRLSYFDNSQAATLLEQVRAFVIEEVATGAFRSAFPYKDMAWINCRYVLTPPELSGQAMFASASTSEYFSGWVINSEIEINLASQSTSTARGLYNSLSLNNNCRFWHNSIFIRPASTTAFRIDFDSDVSNSSPTCQFFNNLFQTDVELVANVGLNNTSDCLKSNAYWQIIGDADTSSRTAYGNDLSAVTLAQLDVLGTNEYRSDLTQQGYAALNVEYDINWNLRPTSGCSDIAPTIGAVELGFIEASGFTGTVTTSQERICSV